MVISSVEPDRDSYRLYIPFHYPSNDGRTSHAVAVSTDFSKHVVSAYTVFLHLIIAETWAIFVILGLRMSVRSLRDIDIHHPNPPSHNTAVISVGILNSNGLKDIAFLALSYLWKLRKEASTRLKLVFWLVVVVIGLLADWGLPIVAAPYLVLGQAAPANPTQIFLPNYTLPSPDPLAQLKYDLDVSYLTTPSALRAVGSAQVANASVRSQVYVGNKEPLQDPNGESFRINYHYNITGQDFGLQDFPDLLLTVEGSCQTTYQYFDHSFVINGTDFGANNNVIGYTLPNSINIDQYTFPGQSLNVSTAIDGSKPLPYFIPISQDANNQTQYNFTYVLLLSTVGRHSISQGSDPFYLTANSTPPNQPFAVLPNRPVLSCWQVDSVINQGISYSYTALATELTTVQPTIASIMASSFGNKILELGYILGSAVLASASDSSIGPFFDAGAADIQADLSKLILTSYISTVNTFTDMTTFSTDNTNVNNYIPPQNLTDASRFVLFSTAVTALSIPMLISIPVIMVTWIGILFILKHCFQSHWFHVNAMRAQVLFRCLDALMNLMRELGLENEMKEKISEVQSGPHRFEQDVESCFNGTPTDQAVCIVPNHRGERVFWELNRTDQSEKAPAVRTVEVVNTLPD
jgi:hypothetical protein